MEDTRFKCKECGGTGKVEKKEVVWLGGYPRVRQERTVLVQCGVCDGSGYVMFQGAQD